MNPRAHVRRTAKGEEEIQTRAHRLDHHLRLVLILVDGTSTVQQLTAKAEGRGDVPEALNRLQAEGYVAVEGLAPVAAAIDAAVLKSELISLARELLGPDATRVIGKLEAAPATPEGLREAAAQCRKVVKLTIDEHKAEELMARCGALLESL